MTATVGPAPDARPATPPVRAGFRGDIQGLRAIAVLLVLGYHAGIPQLAGGFVGVDVFFVISGYLITGLILKEVERTGTLSLSSFYSRRARRLLPATAVVLAVTAAITIAVVPVTRWATIVWDLFTSALYVTNWWLADQAVEYLAAEGAPSPVQHFWTLAVEEQFYVVWPLLLLVLVHLHRRTGWRLRPLLLTAIVLLAAASFAWSVALTSSSPGRAYFVSTTRVWELAIGAMLAFGSARASRLAPGARQVLAVGGLGAVAYAALSFDALTAFPGAAALVPTVGTAAIIAAGTGGTASRVDGLLDNRPMRAIGGLSYSLYLWHWPLLVGAREVWAEPGEPLSVTVGLLVVAATAIPAWLTFRFVEAPIHHAPGLAHHPRRNLAVGVVCTVVGVAAAGAVAVAAPQTGEPRTGGSAAGAAVLGDDPGAATGPRPDAVDSADFVPGPVEALEDVATLGGESCIQTMDGVELSPCEYGPADADTVVAVVGDSKMHQWLSAIERIADERGWRVVTYLKSACPLARVPTVRHGAVNQPCVDHNELRYQALLTSDEIDVVLTSQRSQTAFLPDRSDDEARAAMVEELSRTWSQLEAAGMAVVVVPDNPDPGTTVPDCVADNLDRLTECSFPRDVGRARSAAPVQLEALERLGAEDRAVALEDWICPGATCPPVIGDVLIYRQGSHLTATYVETLADRLDEEIARVLASD